MSFSADPPPIERVLLLRNAPAGCSINEIWSFFFSPSNTFFPLPRSVLIVCKYCSLDISICPVDSHTAFFKSYATYALPSRGGPRRAPEPVHPPSTSPLRACHHQRDFTHPYLRLRPRPRPHPSPNSTRDITDSSIALSLYFPSPAKSAT